MFSGIVEETGAVTAVSASSLSIKADVVFGDLKPGDSIAVNGVCLTVTRIKGKIFDADVMPETIMRSTLGLLRSGDAVNLERALTLSGRLGGHLVEGHIDSTGIIDSIKRDGEAELVTVTASPEVMSFLVEKGFIAVDGLSLTVVGRTQKDFTISLVAFTRSHTTMGHRKVGDRVNLEVDIIAKYVESFVIRQESRITEGFLAEHGFVS